MRRPTEPDQSDCCGSGCNPCIFDVYQKQLEKYEKYLRNSELIEEPFNAISQLEYTKFKVIDKIDICDSHKLLVFKGELKLNALWWNPGQHFLYKYIDENKSCTRAYTPIILCNKVDESKNYDFMIIVKDYGNNSISSKLCSLNIGDETLWRGPYGTYKSSPNEFQRIIMVAQGTGIAPLYSIIKNIIDNEENFTNIILLYCCKNLKNILLRQELYDFNSFWNFSYRIFLSGYNNDTLMYKEPIEYHKLDDKYINTYGPFSSSDQVLLCGSEDFMQYFQHIFQKIGIMPNNVIKF